MSVGFMKFNVNPKNKRTSDCVTRALATVLEISWEDACKEQFNMMMKTGYAYNDKRLEALILAKYGFTKHIQPKHSDGTKYKVRELDEVLDLSDKRVYVLVPSHATSVINGVVNDTWDCRDYTIRNYWTKKEVE